MEYKISVLGMNPESFIDGTGIRIVIYCAGCSHRCKNCHNPQTWNTANGTLTLVQDIYNMIISCSNPLTTGITFTGGDPMYQAEAFCELAKLIKNNSQYDIWCYTGYTFEDIVSNRNEKFELLKNVDVLVDGRYIDELRDLRLAFRGSSNQRIIDVRESLKQNAVINYDINVYAKGSR